MSIDVKDFKKVDLKTVKYGLDCSILPDRTKQANKDECDINKIIKRFEKTGMVDHLNTTEPYYADVSELVGYQEALNVVNKAEELFLSLSTEVRERFGNDPQKLFEFVNKEENIPEMVKLGIAVLREPVKAKEVTPPVDGGGSGDVKP